MLGSRFTSLLKICNPKICYSFAEAPKKIIEFDKEFSEILSQNSNNQVYSTGRPWRSDQLRLKSNEDLHKLWFVCVKQKNILKADRVVEKKFKETNLMKPRLGQVDITMKRILTIIKERDRIKKQYRQKLENEYIEKKKEQLRERLSKQEEKLPEITWQMLRQKYIELRKGVDNVKYLERIWEKTDEEKARKARMHMRLKTNKQKNFKSFWQYEMSIGERPLQEEVLRTHIRNWKSLNLKQRKIILGFLNARRSKDAKASFIKQLRILGDKIAQDQIKSRIEQSKKVDE